MVQATSIGSTGQIFGTGLGFLIPTLIVDSKVDDFENDVNVTTEAFEENFGIRDQLIILFSGTTGKHISFTWIIAEKKWTWVRIYIFKPCLYSLWSLCWPFITKIQLIYRTKPSEYEINTNLGGPHKHQHLRHLVKLSGVESNWFLNWKFFGYL